MNKKLILLLFTLSLVLCGCSNDDDLSADYYVKYEATVTSQYGGSIKYTVNTETGSETFESGKSFSQIFGPVKKGFQASITADSKALNYVSNSNVKIYVCRGSEPFALKANNSSSIGKIVSASYTIDY